MTDYQAPSPLAADRPGFLDAIGRLVAAGIIPLRKPCGVCMVCAGRVQGNVECDGAAVLDAVDWPVELATAIGRAERAEAAIARADEAAIRADERDRVIGEINECLHLSEGESAAIGLLRWILTQNQREQARPRRAKAPEAPGAFASAFRTVSPALEDDGE
jgi:hypothetical protein